MPTNEQAKRFFDVVYKHTTRNPNGYSISTGAEGTTEHDTQQCKHCGKHWDVKPGSGIRRGFCTKCNGMVCGARECHECFPLEKRMDYYEKGRIPDLMAPLDTVSTPKKFIIEV